MTHQIAKYVASTFFFISASACSSPSRGRHEPVDGQIRLTDGGTLSDGRPPIADAGPPATRSPAESRQINALVGFAPKFVSQGGDSDVDRGVQGEPRNLQLGDGTFVCTEHSHILTRELVEFAALHPNADVLHPLSPLQGKSVESGVLNPIPVRLAPGTITLTVAAGTTATYHAEIEQPSLSEIYAAMNKILSSYSGEKTPAQLYFLMEEVHSSNQLAVAIGANVKGPTWAANIGLNWNASEKKSRVLIRFVQKYVTIAATPPQGAAGFFHPSVAAKDLQPYVGPDNTPVYVASVSYGRTLYLLFESDASMGTLKAALQASFGGAAVSGGIDVSVMSERTLEQSRVVVFAQGGQVQPILSAAGGPKDELLAAVQSYLSEGANFDKSNPGVPISYTLRHLDDSSQVKLALTSEYPKDECSPALAMTRVDRVLSPWKHRYVLGISEDEEYGGACAPGFKRVDCKVHTVKSKDGKCWTIGIGGTGWKSTDEHDCKCLVHYGAGGGWDDGIQCEVVITQVEDK